MRRKKVWQQTDALMGIGTIIPGNKAIGREFSGITPMFGKAAITFWMKRTAGKFGLLPGFLLYVFFYT